LKSLRFFETRLDSAATQLVHNGGVERSNAKRSACGVLLMCQAARYKKKLPAESYAMSKIIIEKDIPILMRDGTMLKGDLYRPDSPQKLPVLLNRTPYGKSGPMIRLALDPLRAALRGYNVLIQDCRGRYRSEGTGPAS
jgi:predicted acyl esterase